MVVAEVLGGADSVVFRGGQQLLTSVVFRERRPSEDVGSNHPLGDVVEAGEVLRRRRDGDTSPFEQHLERKLPVVLVPPGALLADPRLEIAGRERALGRDSFVDQFDVVSVFRLPPAYSRPVALSVHPPPVEVVLVGRDQARLVDPVFEQFAVAVASGISERGCGPSRAKSGSS